MLRICPTCGQKNRIPAKHIADDGVCGACKAVLGADVVVHVDAADFDAVVAAARVPVLVDFYADWCGPCRAAAPHLEGLAKEMKNKAVILKVNTDNEPQLARRFGVRGIPHFVVLSHGKPVVEQAGLVDKAQMRAWLTAAGA